jgi:predicted transcriptional regulator
MTTATAFNTFGTQHSRVVAKFDVVDMNDAVRIAAKWNSDEARKDMRVNFVSLDGKMRSLADVALPLFQVQS